MYYTLQQLPKVVEKYDIKGLGFSNTGESSVDTAKRLFSTALKGDKVLVSLGKDNDKFIIKECIGDNQWRTFNGTKVYNGPNSALVYVPYLGEFIRVSEGDGSNLDNDDTDQGYVDYVYFDTLIYDGDNLVEHDGGQIMLDKPFDESYTNLDEVIKSSIEFMYGDRDLDYIVIKEFNKK